jgi:peptidyl-prolyl cis-trans isomerase B (cyclophilin B)
MRPVLALLALLVALTGCGSSSSKDEDEARATATPNPTAAADAAGCQQVAAPKPRDDGSLKAPTLTLDPKRTYTATVKTSCGAFTIALDVKRAPKTSASFAFLARKGFFDKTTFHRISPGFVIQGGDPTGTGQGGSGYSVHEKPPADLSYKRGVVAMAKTGTEPAGTSGSQFFVVTADSQLPPDYALLGRVTGGQDAVNAIATTPTDPSKEQPLSPVVIDSITVKES